MILSGDTIRARLGSDIVIDPFDESQLNPNSYNLTLHNAAGIAGTGTGVGNSTLTTFFPGAIVTTNVMVGGHASAYPRGNFFPASLDQVGFTARLGGDYRLAASSRYRRAGTDGRDPGADLDALAGALERSANRHAAAARPSP